MLDKNTKPTKLVASKDALNLTVAEMISRRYFVAKYLGRAYEGVCEAACTYCW